MKIRNLYTCEICYKEYGIKEECEKCESFHKTDLEIVDKEYSSYKNADINGFPDSIQVKDKKGEAVETYYSHSYIYFWI